jgi:hypothetical protein
LYAFAAMSVDSTNGNILVGGGSNKLTTLDYNMFTPTSTRNAFIIFLNNLGDIMWGYTFGMLSSAGT